MARFAPFAAALAAGAALFVAYGPSFAADGVVNAPRPTLVEPVSGHSETAIFAGGCFWGVQGVFAHVKGVTATTAGYTGGKAATAEYETVSGGNTGHAESVKVVFDPTQRQLRRPAAHLFLGGDRSDRGRSPGPRRGLANIARRCSRSRRPRRRWRAPISRSSPPRTSMPRRSRPGSSRRRASTRPRAITRTSWRINPDYPYIVVNDRPKVEALKRIFPQSYHA